VRRSFAVIASAALLGLVALAGPAQAKTPTPPGAAVAAEHQRIVGYWTPARQAHAIPREVPGPQPTRKPPGTPGGGPGGGGGGDGSSGTSTVTGATWTGGGAVVKTTGKVFLTLGTTDYVCSGSAVSSGSASVVVTAGHCVHDLSLHWATNWMFVPAYSGNGNAPYGAWTATTLFTTAGWFDSENFTDDAGFAVVTGDSSLDGALGTLPSISFSSGATSSDPHYAFGYPAAKKYKGNTLAYCRGPIQLGAYDADQTLSMSCDMTGGSSGGPWFENWNDTAQTGTIMSLNSYGYLSLAKVMFGPVFDGPEQTAYNAATNTTCVTYCVSYGP
jgi:V8-like Glu-specific endopeptidase